jgi:hypothetical protein
MVQPEVAQAAAAGPFVEVAGQQGRQPFRLLLQIVEDRARLPASPEPRQIQMHPDDAQAPLGHHKIGQHGAARLERGQVQRLVAFYPDMRRNQNGIAVPAHAAVPHLVRDGPISSLFGQQVQRDRAVALAKAPVCFLQDDDVRTDLAEHLENALGSPAPVGRDGLVDIVACNQHHAAEPIPANTVPIAQSECDNAATALSFLLRHRANVAARKGAV